MNLPCSIVLSWLGAAGLALAAGPQPSPQQATPPSPTSPEARMKLKVEAGISCSPVVAGVKCLVDLRVTNLSEDLVVVKSLTTDRPADAQGEYLKQAYGSLSESKPGRIEHNTMTQVATPGVFFDLGSLLLPGEKKSFSVATRFFGSNRKLTLKSFKIPAAQLSKFIYLKQSLAKSKKPSGGTVAYQAVTGIGALKPKKDPQATFILWNSKNLIPDEVEVEVEAEVRDPAFPLKSAQGKLPAGEKVEEVSFSDTFAGWLLKGPGGVWLVREQGAEKIGEVAIEAFEKIDEVKGKNVKFGVPAEAFQDKFKLSPGDGMYTHGSFLTASGDDILGVLRLAREKGLRTGVNIYFFTSWYLAVTPAATK